MPHSIEAGAGASAPGGRSPRIEVLILARDEAEVLPLSLSSILPQMQPADRLTVVADHCRDGTAEVARSMGAHVLSRQRGPTGKGEALKWWLIQTRGESQPDDAVVIMDADSWARPKFLATMRRRFQAGELVVQAMLEPVPDRTVGPGRLASLSETMDQGVFDRLASHLGWPVRLRGTGMGLRRTVLERVAPGLGTEVEDAELTLQLGALRYDIRLAPDAVVLDAKPETDLAAIRQRARWLKGQLRLAQRHPRELGALVMKGPRGWYLLSAVFFKPRSLTILVRVGLLLALLLGRSVLGQVGVAGQLIVGGSLLIDGAAFVAAVWRSSDRRIAALSLTRLPAFVLIWFRSLLLATHSRESWLRARPPAHDPGMTSPDPAAP